MLKRVKPFTKEDVFANVYTIIDNELVIVYTRSLADEFNRAFNEYLNGRSYQEAFNFKMGYKGD